MAQTNINIKIDKDLKESFDKLCNDIGMSMTTAFIIYAKTAVREQRIPFEVRAQNIKDLDPHFDLALKIAEDDIKYDRTYELEEAFKKIKENNAKKK